MLQCVSVVGNKIGMSRANVETMGPLLIGINAGIRFGTPNLIEFIRNIYVLSCNILFLTY